MGCSAVEFAYYTYPKDLVLKDVAESNSRFPSVPEQDAVFPPAPQLLACSWTWPMHADIFSWNALQTTCQSSNHHWLRFREERNHSVILETSECKDSFLKGINNVLWLGNIFEIIFTIWITIFYIMNITVFDQLYILYIKYNMSNTVHLRPRPLHTL